MLQTSCWPFAWAKPILSKLLDPCLFVSSARGEHCQECEEHAVEQSCFISQEITKPGTFAPSQWFKFTKVNNNFAASESEMWGNKPTLLTFLAGAVQGTLLRALPH